MSKSKIFFYLCLSFIIGIAGAPYLHLAPFFKLFFVLAAAIFAFVSWQNRKILVYAFCLIFIIFGLWRYDAAVYRETNQNLSYYNDKDYVLFKGKVAVEPDIRQGQTKITMQAEKFYLISSIETKEFKKELGRAIQPEYLEDFPQEKISGQVLLTVPRQPEYQYGDQLLILGKLTEPKTSKDGDFSYRDYLARYNIYSLSNYPKTILVSRGNGNNFISTILKIKNHFEKTINQILPEPHAAFLGGLLLGARKSIPQDLLNKFNTVGVTHIVAVSGYNITIIAGAIGVLLRKKFTRKKSFWLAVLAIFIFVILTGATASVVRAAIMGILVLLARHSGRFSNATNSLAFAASIMLLINPKIFAIDLGFQLSFLATLGIVYFMPYVEKMIKWMPEFFQIRESAAMTLSAQILVIPKILLSFSRISLISPLANILILPIIPATMFVGFLTGVVGQLSIFLGKIIGYFSYSFLNYEIFVVDYLSKVPYASVQFEEVGKWGIWGYFIIIAILFVYLKRKEKQLLSKNK